jgi:hypothetical protein
VVCSPRSQLRTPRSDGGRLEAAHGKSLLRLHLDGSPHDRIRCPMQDLLLRKRIRSWPVPRAIIWYIIIELFLCWGLEAYVDVSILKVHE